MIGIIPAAGEGSRLGMGCKSLINIWDKPLITFVLDAMVDAGINHIIIIQNGHEISNKIGNKYRGKEISYAQQEERLGISHAIRCAKNANEMLIILGDIIYIGIDLKAFIKRFKESNLDCLYGVKRIEDKSQISKSYGVTYQGDIIEKPSKVSDIRPLLGLGIYCASNAFFDYIDATSPSEDGEIQITDTLNIIPKDKIDYMELKGFYWNINTKEDLEAFRG